MRITLCYLITALTISVSYAQNQGVVIYEESVKMTIEVPPGMEGMFPSEMKNEKALYFDTNESIYKNLPKDENVASEIESSSDGAQIVIKMETPQEETYRNLKDGILLEKKELFGRTFLVTGDPEKVKWKVSSDQRKIAGFTCIKATHMRDTIPVTAWFTLQIPVQNGPGLYGDLPGLILAIDEDNGARVTRALSVDLRPLNDDEEIEIPTKGKEITREKFEKVREEKMKEMEEMGGGNRVIIRHN